MHIYTYMKKKATAELPIKTTGGNSDGANCYFPFIYEGIEYRTCIYKELKELDGSTYALFCATTANYDVLENLIYNEPKLKCFKN
jgi:hypothetical protein